MTVLLGHCHFELGLGLARFRFEINSCVMSVCLKDIGSSSRTLIGSR